MISNAISAGLEMNSLNDAVIMGICSGHQFNEISLLQRKRSRGQMEVERRRWMKNQMKMRWKKGEETESKHRRSTKQILGKKLSAKKHLCLVE